MNMKRWVAAILTAMALVGTTIPAFAVSGGGTFKKYSFSDTSSNQADEPAQDTNSAYANPTDFLNSMAKGIDARLKESGLDTSDMNSEEHAAYFRRLVSCELNEIEQYSNLTFADEKFNKLAHCYIEACQLQAFALENYENDLLYDALWTSGRISRSGIIITMYDEYDLPITEEQVDGYRPEPVEDNTQDILEWENAGSGDIVFSDGDLYITASTIEFDEKSAGSEDEHFNYSFTVMNNSEYSIDSMSIGCAITDEDGNIIGEDRIWVNRTIPSKKTALFQDKLYTQEYSAPVLIVPDEFTYDCNGDTYAYSLNISEENKSEFTLKAVKTSEKSNENDESSQIMDIDKYTKDIMGTWDAAFLYEGGDEFTDANINLWARFVSDGTGFIDFAGDRYPIKWSYSEEKDDMTLYRLEMDGDVRYIGFVTDAHNSFFHKLILHLDDDLDVILERRR